MIVTEVREDYIRFPLFFPKPPKSLNMIMSIKIEKFVEKSKNNELKLALNFY